MITESHAEGNLFAGKHFLLIVENNSVPFDKRVWREATALREAGAKVSVIAPAHGVDNSPFEVVEDVRVFRYPLRFSDGSKAGYVYEYLAAFIRTVILFHRTWIREGKFDVVHVANPPDIFWPLALYCKLFRIKFIFDEHDLTPETLLSRFGISESKPGFLFKVLKLFQKLSYRFSDAVISTNESYRERASRVLAKQKEKIFVVRNGPDLRRFNARPPDLRLKKGRKFLFGYIGIMAVQDGVDYVIEATRYLVRERGFKDFIVYLIGSGSDIERLKQLVDRYSLNDYVVFTGRIPDEPALVILSTADICLSPDPYNPLNDESTMNKVMEYMALGKPVVSFDLKEARFSAMGAAIYVKNNDVQAFAEGILALVNDGQMTAEMSKKGMERIRDSLSWEKQIRSLLNCYSFVLPS